MSGLALPVVAAVLLATAAPARAQDEDARAAYLRAYGIVAGQVQAVETVQALCAERFPADAAARDAAVRAWRERHRALLRLVADQAAVMAADNEGRPEAERIDVPRLEEARDRLRERARRALDQDPGRLRAICDDLARTLETPEVDALEARHADEIARLRRGPRGDAPTALP